MFSIAFRRRLTNLEMVVNNAAFSASFKDKNDEGSRA